jgi:hypothetical protein
VAAGLAVDIVSAALTACFSETFDRSKDRSLHSDSPG